MMKSYLFHCSREVASTKPFIVGVLGLVSGIFNGLDTPCVPFPHCWNAEEGKEGCARKQSPATVCELPTIYCVCKNWEREHCVSVNTHLECSYCIVS